MKEPFAPFINYAGSHYAFIFPPEVIQQDGELGKRVIGTGPFMLTDLMRRK
jgi:ABC-type transport system substrate-binding protein